jgi:hypothetical protein
LQGRRHLCPSHVRTTADVVENRTDFGIFERAPQRGINYAAYPATCSAMRAQRNLGFHLVLLCQNF